MKLVDESFSDLPTPLLSDPWTVRQMLEAIL